MPEAHMLHASIVGVADRHEEAIAVYEKVLKLSPGKTGAMCSMAHHLKTVGRQDDAIAQYRACIATRDDSCEAYWSLANLKTFRFEEAEVQAMHELLDSERPTDESRAQMHNALGLEYEAARILTTRSRISSNAIFCSAGESLTTRLKRKARTIASSNYSTASFCIAGSDNRCSRCPSSSSACRAPARR